jgi:hypothetical protein
MPAGANNMQSLLIQVFAAFNLKLIIKQKKYMRYKIIILILAFIVIQNRAKAQTNNGGNTTPGVIVAHRIAKKMKDTLDLTGNQRNQIYTININLHQQKIIARNQHPGNDSLTTVAVQAVENKRDSLYQGVLPLIKYNLYRQKKRNLLN